MDSLLATAMEAAEAASRVHTAHFQEVGVEGAREKAQSDFVTRVDLEAQAAAVSVIREAFPDHHILAEEDEDAIRGWPPDGGFLWIVDPLDGTTNFLHGHPMFGASVAVGRNVPGVAEGHGNPGLRFEGQLDAGAISAPRTQERWWAERGGGAWKNGRRIQVSRITSLGKALVGTGFPFKAPELVPRYTDQFKRVLPASGGIRRGGSAALDLCYLAEGILDAFWEEDYLSPWDSAAGLLILSEAGGVASRLNGSPIDLRNGSILAGNSWPMAETLRSTLMGPEK